MKALAAFGSGPLRAPILDARRGEIYGGLYDAGLNAIAPERVAPIGDWLRTLPAGPIEFISSDFAPFAEALAGAVVTIAPRALAGAIARIASRGLGIDPADVDANYVRRSDAELFWKGK